MSIPEYFTAQPVCCKNCHCEKFKVAFNFAKNLLAVKCAKCGSSTLLSVNETIEGNVAEEPSAQK